MTYADVDHATKGTARKRSTNASGLIMDVLLSGHLVSTVRLVSRRRANPSSCASHGAPSAANLNCSSRSWSVATAGSSNAIPQRKRFLSRCLGRTSTPSTGPRKGSFQPLHPAFQFIPRVFHVAAQAFQLGGLRPSHPQV